MSEYPEHEKMKAVKGQSQAIGEFLNWLTVERESVIAKWGCPHGYTDRAECESPYCGDEDILDDAQLWPVRESIEQLLAAYFDIDLQIISEEKEQMLADLREAQGAGAT